MCQAGPGEFLTDITVASHTQLATPHQADQGEVCKNNRVSSALLNDSDEVPYSLNWGNKYNSVLMF